MLYYFSCRFYVLFQDTLVSCDRKHLPSKGGTFFYHKTFAFLFALIDDISATPINHAPSNQVITSGTSWKALINMMTASAKIARNAPCSRYLYFVSVHFLTSMIVKLLTNIAPIPSHKAMMKIFLLSAKAPMTPSNEKLASSTSKYRNRDSQILAVFCVSILFLSSSHASPSTITYIVIHRNHDIRNEMTSLPGSDFVMPIRTSNVIMISMDLSSQIFFNPLSIGAIQ